MSEKFLHGVEVVEIDNGARPIQTVRSSVIGIVGTAPDAEQAAAASASIGVVSSNNAVTFTAANEGVAGNGISVKLVNPNANNAALSVTVDGLQIVVNLATSAGGAITTTATQLIAAIAANTAAAALVTASNTGASTGAGVVPVVARTFLAGGLDEAFPLDTPVLIAGSRAHAGKLGETGTLPRALDGIFDQTGAVVVVVRVAEGVDDAATMANVIGGVNVTTGAYEGLQAFLAAKSVTGQTPRILCAPGFTHQRDTTANPVVAELIGVAERLRAVIVADGPNTTDADAIQYAGDFGSKRILVVEPFVKVLNTVTAEIEEEPASARVAGLIAKIDNDRGFWWSPSNQTINGIVGTSRPIDFTLGDSNSRANLLNEAKVACIIREDGFRLWGNRTLSDDPKWAFLSVVRTADIINDSILVNHRWAVDRNITRTYLEDVAGGVNAYLDTLKAQEAILGGECWPDPDLNTPANISAGKVYFTFEFTPPYPAEHVIFRSQLVNDYITEILPA